MDKLLGRISSHTLMGIFKKIGERLNKILHAGKAIKGDEAIDSYFFHIEEYESEEKAKRIFNAQKEKLISDIDHWTNLSDLEDLSFLHFDPEGNKITGKAKKGDFIKINMPKPFPFFWVSIDSIINMPDKAEILLRPSYDPTERPVRKEITAHFFDRETTNKITLERKGKRVIAEVNGSSEVINNTGEEAGEHSFLNTTVALGGWAGMQKKQWASFTKNLSKGL